MTYNKSAIFKKAWNQYGFRKRHYWLKEEQKTFGSYLKEAWKDAKHESAKEARREEDARELAGQLAIKEAARARAVAALSDADRETYDALKKEMFLIDMIDRWSDKDRQRRDELQARIDILETEKAPATIVAKAA